MKYITSSPKSPQYAAQLHFVVHRAETSIITILHHMVLFRSVLIRPYPLRMNKNRIKTE